MAALPTQSDEEESDEEDVIAPGFTSNYSNKALVPPLPPTRTNTIPLFDAQEVKEKPEIVQYSNQNEDGATQEVKDETKIVQYRNESANEECCKGQKLIKGKEILCPCLRRIEKTLRVYQQVLVNNSANSNLNVILTQLKDDIHKEIKNDLYDHQQLFDDFSHVTLIHIDPNKIRFRSKRHRSEVDVCEDHCIACLIEHFETELPRCEIGKCQAFLRHYKDRGSVSYISDKSNESGGDAYDVNQKPAITYAELDLMDEVFKQECDKIHSYFLHSTIKLGAVYSENDIDEWKETDSRAHLMKSSRFTKDYDKKDEGDKKEEETKEKQMQHIGSKQEEETQMQYIGSKQDDKWWHEVIPKENEPTKEKKKKKQTKEEIYKILVSQIGVFRWQKPHGFKERQNQEFLLQKPRFNNLKEEVLNNDFCELSKEKWNQTIRKSQIFGKSLAARRIRTRYKSSFSDQICNHYQEWNEGIQITIQEIVTLKLYTDFDRLQFELKKCFRLETLQDILKTNDAEDDDTSHELLTRLQEFFYWRGGLLVMLHKFGTKFKDGKMILYHGVNTKMLLRPSVSQGFNGPLSTSSSYHVARTFSTAKGMVLEITTQYPRASFCNAFNCGLISDFPEEQEWLIGFMYVRILRVTTRELASDITKWIDLLKKHPISSIAREMFFAVHLFREQIFSMSDHLERILNEFLKVNTFDCCKDCKCDNDGCKNCKNKDHTNECWKECDLQMKICAFGAKHPKGVEHMEEKKERPEWKDWENKFSPEKLKDIHRQMAIIPVLWDKFEEFALKPNNGQRIKLDKVSDRLAPNFMRKTKIDGEKEKKWRIDFHRITEVFKNVMEIKFMNLYILDDIVLKRFVKQIKKTPRDCTPCIDNKDAIIVDDKDPKKIQSRLEEENTIKKISFLYFDCEFDENGKPSDSEIFQDPDTLDKNDLKDLKDAGWKINFHSHPKNGYKIEIKRK